MNCSSSSELEGLYPEDVEGIDALMERARRRVARHSSTAGTYQSSDGPSSLRSVASDQTPCFSPSVRRAVSLAPRSPRVRKVSAGLDPYPEAPESQHLMDRRVGASQDNARGPLDEETPDDESQL